MCMFSRSVRSVAGTSIFMREISKGNHGLAYSMTVAATSPVAMILPVPVLKGTGEEALTFVNLKDYPNFFADLAKCFPEERERGFHSKGLLRSRGPNLRVHDVGDFIASYVPSIPDFDRLDEVFRLPATVWDHLPSYHDYGFAVFQLKATAQPKKVHPMAFTYPAEDASQLFFPTYHIHDGEIESHADYDHVLYYQASQNFSGGIFEQGGNLPNDVVEIDKTHGLVCEDQPILRHEIKAHIKNCDHILLDAGTSLQLVTPVAG